MTFAVAACAVVLCAPPQPYQRWADEARVPSVQRAVTLRLAGCPDDPGRSCTQEGLPEIWLARTPRARHDLYHEMGHLFDYFGMTGAARAQFRSLRHDTRPWRSPPNSPNEQFAEAYAFCASGQEPLFAGRVMGGYDYTPSLRVHERICALIRSIELDSAAVPRAQLRIRSPRGSKSGSSATLPATHTPKISTSTGVPGSASPAGR